MGLGVAGYGESPCRTSGHRSSLFSDWGRELVSVAWVYIALAGRVITRGSTECAGQVWVALTGIREVGQKMMTVPVAL